VTLDHPHSLTATTAHPLHVDVSQVIMIIDSVVVRGEKSTETVLLPILAVVISAVPVALPIVITITLAMGASKMAKEGALVTNLAALQEISSMDLLCSDKTGTLTTAKMTVYADKVWATPWLTAGEFSTPIERVLMYVYPPSHTCVFACASIVSLLAGSTGAGRPAESL
jgi:P-type E1-E2 ATPase